MIQQVNVMQQTKQPAVKQTTRSTGDDFEKHLVGENGESDEITVNKYGGTDNQTEKLYVKTNNLDMTAKVPIMFVYGALLNDI